LNTKPFAKKANNGHEVSKFYRKAKRKKYIQEGKMVRTNKEKTRRRAGLRRIQDREGKDVV